MKPEELEESLKSNKNSVRYYKRIVAMRLIEYGFSHKETANILKMDIELFIDGLKPAKNQV